MKRCLAAVLVAMLLLTGCSPVTGDISDLINPPKLTAEQQAVEKALTDTLGGKSRFTLKYPLSGDYRSSFVLHDLDSDNDAEALAFYCPSTDNAGTHVMILKKTRGKWAKIADLSGDGNDVEQIDFGDYYGAGYDDVAVAWTQLSGTGLGLGVYSIDGRKYTTGGTFTAMKTVTLASDKRQDILLFKLDTTAHKASASLVSYSDGRLGESADTPMDPTVSRYAGVYSTKVGGKNAVLVDGYKGPHDMVTELITYEAGALQSPFYDPVKKIVNSTLRDVPVTCESFDDDSYLIPRAVELPGYTGISDYSRKLWLLSWVTPENINNVRFSCVMNNTMGYYFLFPAAWNTGAGKNVTVTAAGDSRWIFSEWDGQKAGDELFRISVYSEDDWKNSREATAGNYVSELTEYNGQVYVAAVNHRAAADPRYLDLNTIKQNFRLMS